MQPPSIIQGRKLACVIVLAQLTVGLVAATVYALLFDRDAWLSAFFGGVTALIPQALFSVYAFAVSGARRAKQVAGAFYRGEALKVSSTVILMWVAYVKLAVNPAVYLATYLLCLATVWVVMFNWRSEPN